MAYTKIPTFSEPNWDEAPEWAQWWAVDKSGANYWYDVKPRPFREVWFADDPFTYKNTLGHMFGRIKMRGTGIDWKTTLRQRPS